MKTSWWAAQVLGLGVALAAVDAHAGEQAIRKVFGEKYPDAPVDAVNRTRYAGLYEVVSRDQLVYTDANGSFVFIGRIIDARTGRDLTFDRRIALSRVDFAALPLELAFKTVKGTGARRMAVFADPDCPFCRQLEDDITRVTDVTVYTFLFPIETIHPSAGMHAEAIWCAEDPGAAWTAFLLEGRSAPVPRDSCDYPKERLAALGQQYKVTGTPTMVFADGRRVPGYVGVAELERLLDGRTEP